MADVFPWSSEQVRVTLFAHSDKKPEAGLWEQLAGTPPENVTHQPRASSVVETGVIGDATLLVQTSSDRIDIVFASQNPASRLALMPHLEELCSKSSKFVAKTPGRAWKRIALGVIALQEARDRQDTLKLLAKYIQPGPPADAYDFLYQINRRRPAKTTVGLQMNRLSKWSSVMAQNIVLSVVSGAVPQFLGDSFVHLARVELDVNTAPDFSGTFAGEAAAKVLQELKGLAIELLEKGDVP